MLFDMEGARLVLMVIFVLHMCFDINENTISFIHLLKNIYDLVVKKRPFTCYHGIHCAPEHEQVILLKFKKLLCKS